MMKFFKDILTDVDNETFDDSRVMEFFSFVSFHLYGFFNIVVNHPWRAVDYAAGVSALAVAFGIKRKLKNDSEKS